MNRRRLIATAAASGLLLAAVAALTPTATAANASAVNRSAGAGYLDQRFGFKGTVTQPSVWALHDVKVSNGRIYTLTGQDRCGFGSGLQLIARTSSGGVDRAFNGGKPLWISNDQSLCSSSSNRLPAELRVLVNGRIRVDQGISGLSRPDILVRTRIVSPTGAIESTSPAVSPRPPLARNGGVTLTDGRTRGCYAQTGAGPNDAYLVGTTREGRFDPEVPTPQSQQGGALCDDTIVGSDGSDRLYSINLGGGPALQARRWLTNGAAAPDYGNAAFSVPGRVFDAVRPGEKFLARTTRAGSLFTATTTRVPGSLSGYRLAITRADTNGNKAADFGSAGVAQPTVPSAFGGASVFPTAFEFGAKGTLVVAVHVAGKGAFLTRLSAATGQVDSTFGSGGWVSLPLEATHLQQGAYGTVLTGGLLVTSSKRDVVLQRRLVAGTQSG